MTRLVRDSDPRPVTAFAVAPHHYTFDRCDPDSDTHRACREAAPYQAGDVVYLDTGDAVPALARVVQTSARRTHYGDLQEFYRVQKATKAGYWSRVWLYAYPGQIQRGYEKQKGKGHD